MLDMAEPKASQHLLEKILSLPPEHVAEVEDFVDFLSVRNSERELVGAVGAVSEAAFAEVWDNADDADYDRL
jgi:hypothetical protein